MSACLSEDMPVDQLKDKTSPGFLSENWLFTTQQVALKTAEAKESRMAGRKVTELEGWKIRGEKSTQGIIQKSEEGKMKESWDLKDAKAKIVFIILGKKIIFTNAQEKETRHKI